MKKQIRIRVNGLDRELEVSTRATLLETVRDQLGLTAATLGCGGQGRGASARRVPGRPVRAFSYPAADADGAEILTTEGLADGDKLHPLQEAFMDCGALQCGYCTSGFLLTAKALLDENPRPSEEKIRDYLAGNFCRCGCYGEIMQAVKKAAGL